MRKIKFILIVLLVMILILSVAVSNVYSKYVTSKKINGNLTITAELGKINIEEASVSSAIIPGMEDFSLTLTE